MKHVIDYFSLVCGRLGILFVAGGLFILAADYVHSFKTEKPSQQEESHVINCVRFGTCEAS